MTISPRFQEPLSASIEERFTVPRIIVDQTRTAYIGPGLKLEPHKMAVATLVIGLADTFELNFFDDRADLSTISRIGLIPPDTLHYLKTSGPMLFLYLDPSGDDHEGLGLHEIAHRTAEKADAVASVLDRELSAPGDTFHEVCTLMGIDVLRTVDPRIARAQQAIDDHADEIVSIEQAASVAELSVSRFQYVFRDSLGTTFRRYRIWRRMRLVALALADGSNLTDAAYAGGFSSSAHLSAAFKSMFGITPSLLVETNADFIIV